MRILYIEDNPEDIIYTSELLEENKHIVDVIDNADDVIDKLRTINNYDLIILDLMFMVGEKIKLEENCPEVGIVLYKKIRESGFKKKILILSALARTELWGYFQKDKKIEYQVKPILSNIESFMKKVEE